jgi:hypothetical protein
MALWGGRFHYSTIDRLEGRPTEQHRAQDRAMTGLEIAERIMRAGKSATATAMLHQINRRLNKKEARGRYIYRLFSEAKCADVAQLVEQRFRKP